MQRSLSASPSPPPDAARLPAPACSASAPQIAFVAGFLYLAIGVLRMGWLIQFLSASVISGFMTGASVTIALSQARTAHMQRTSRGAGFPS